MEPWFVLPQNENPQRYHKTNQRRGHPNQVMQQLGLKCPQDQMQVHFTKCRQGFLQRGEQAMQTEIAKCTQGHMQVCFEMILLGSQLLGMLHQPPKQPTSMMELELMQLRNLPAQ
jgi:hypothetical protein